MKTRGVVAEAVHAGNPAVIKKTRDKSLAKASEMRWNHETSPLRTPTDEPVGSHTSEIVSGDTSLRTGARVVNEFIIGLIEHKNAIDDGRVESVSAIGLSSTELAAVKQLSETIAGTILNEMEGQLGKGGPREGQKVDHFFCVVLAAVCQAYDTFDGCASKSNSELARAIVDLIERSIEDSSDEAHNPSPRIVEFDKGRGTKRISRQRKDSFDTLQGDFFYRIVLKLLEAMRKTAMAPIENGVLLHLRVIAAITCPDPDRHPSVIKFCIWPLLKGPLKQLLSDEAAETMETWLVETYPKEALS